MSVAVDNGVTAVQLLGPDAARSCAALAATRLLQSWTAAQFRDELSRPDRFWHGLVIRGEQVAIAGVWDAPDMAHLQLVVVAADHEGDGLAGILLDHVIAEAAARGRAVMTLEVHEANHRALALYRSRGFVDVGRRPDYFADGDALLLTRAR